MLNLEIGKQNPVVLLFPEYNRTDLRTHTIGVVMVDHASESERTQIALTMPRHILIFRADIWPKVINDYPDAVYAQTGKRVRDLGPTDDVFQLPVLTQKKPYAHRKKNRP